MVIRAGIYIYTSESHTTAAHASARFRPEEQGSNQGTDDLKSAQSGCAGGMENSNKRIDTVVLLSIYFIILAFRKDNAQNMNIN